MGFTFSERFLKTGARLRMLVVLVSQHDQLLGKYNWDDDCRRNIYSATKTFTSAAVGIAASEGLLSLSEPLTRAFSDDLPDAVSAPLAAATVRDLLTMGLGQASAAFMGGQRPFYEETDWVRKALALPFAEMPGTTFLYNNVGPYLAGVLVARRAGCTLQEYLKDRLFQPLHIGHPTWEIDPQGNAFGAGGLMLNAPELHRFGETWLHGGSFEGRQLIPSAFITQAMKKQAPEAPFNPYGYGYLIWGERENGWRIDGKYGQLSLILPDRDAVITCLCECRDTNALRDLLFEELVSQLDE